MLVKRIAAFLAFTLLVVSFQNCSAPKKTAADSPSGGDTKLVGKLDLSQLEKVEFSSDNYAENSPYLDLNLSLNVDTGVITADSGETFCLSDSELVEAKSILSTASICDARENMPEDMVCAQVYVRDPYARIVSANDQVALGGESDGCGKSIDLCDDHANLLKGFLAHVRNDLQDRSCSFENL